MNGITKSAANIEKSQGVAKKHREHYVRLAENRQIIRSIMAIRCSLYGFLGKGIFLFPFCRIFRYSAHMKGVILAGGNATRLYPLTKITNKHLLPLYNKPVIFHAVEKLVNAGIDRIMIVLSPQYLDDFVSVLGSGQAFKSKNGDHQIQIVYGIHNEPGGIAQGLCIAHDFVGDDSVVLHLGDNIIEDDITEQVRNFTGGAKVFLKEVRDPERFGVAILDENNRVVEIIEKPKTPVSNLAVVGVYIYDNTVFAKMKGQPKSDRGEYEITWVNNRYIDEGSLDVGRIEGAWFDVGTFDSLLTASNYMKKKEDMKQAQS